MDVRNCRRYSSWFLDRMSECCMYFFDCLFCTVNFL